MAKDSVDWYYKFGVTVDEMMLFLKGRPSRE